MKIPFVDLKLQYQNYQTEIDSSIQSVIRDTAFVGGNNNKYVQAFEKDFAEYLGVKNVVSCANGTDSIEILLEAYGIGKGDEVLVPAVSWISTSEAVGRCGAKPVFIDVCEDTLLINLDLIEQNITSNTKAIIPVHLYGNTVNMEKLMDLANANRLIVIEDCAQSHGSRYHGKLSGTFGHAASFSFYPGKNLGAYGDAGGIATNDHEIAKTCRMIANHGQPEKHNHVIEGRNSRMDGIHASILSAKLKHLDQWNLARQKNAETYHLLLNNHHIIKPKVNSGASHVYHLYVIQSENRDALKKHLTEQQIETAIHYPTALPFLKAYESFNYQKSDFPVASKITDNILSLPMFPELTNEQIQYISNAINSFK